MRSMTAATVSTACHANRTNNSIAGLVRKNILKLLVGVFVVLGSMGVKAQTALPYTFGQAAGTYTALVGGTVFQTGAATSTNANSGLVNIGFTFNFNGVNYTQLNISNNGFVTFGTTLPAVASVNAISISTAYDGAIAGYGFNLVASAVAGAAPEISYGIQGSDFVVQFTDVARTGIAGDRMSFQIRLTQTTNVIKIVYNNWAATTTTTSVTNFGQVGMRGATNGAFLDRMVFTTAPYNTWLTSGGGSDNGTAASQTTSTSSSNPGPDIVRYNSTFLPPNGLTYTYTPVSASFYQSLPYSQNFEAWQNLQAVKDVPGNGIISSPSTGNGSIRAHNETLANSAWGSTSGGAVAVPGAGQGTTCARLHSFDYASGSKGYMDFYLNFTTVGSKILTFDLINTSSARPVKVYLSTDGGITFGASLATFNSTLSVWTNVSVALGSSTSATCVVRIEMQADFASASDVGLDNVSVAFPPACSAPTGLLVTDINPTTVDLNWVAPGSGTPATYDWEIRTSGAGGSGAVGLTTSGNTTAPVVTVDNVPGLTAATVYNLYVRTNCSGGAGTSAWAGPYTFTTSLDCSLATALTCGSSVTSGNLAVAGGSYSFPGTAPTNSCGFTTPGKEKLYTFTSGAAGTYTLNITSVNSGSGFIDYFFKPASGGCGPTGWTCIKDLSAVSTTTFTLAASTTYFLLLDAESAASTANHTFKIDCPAACSVPTGLTVSDIQLTTVDIAWTAGSPGTAASFDWEIRTSGAGGSGAVGLTTSGTTANGTILSVDNVPGLTAATSYSLYVRKNCTSGDGSSLWAGPTAFTTAAAGESCATAGFITVYANAGAAVNTLLATGNTADGLPGTCSDATGNPNKRDRWVKFVAPSNGNKIIIKTTSGTTTDAVMQVWSTCPPAGTAMGCNDDISGSNMPELSFCQNQYVGGQTYYVQIWPYSDAAGNFNVKIYEDVPCPLPPANDECAGTISLPINASGACPAAAVTGTTINSTASAGVVKTTCDAFAAYRDVFYTFNSGNHTAVKVDFTSTSGANKIAFYSGCGTSYLGVCSASPLATTITGLTPNTNYTILVYSLVGSEGTFTICLSAVDYTFTGTGNYSDAARWTPVAPGNSIGVGSTLTVAPGAACTLNVAVNNAGVIVNNGSFINTSTLTNTGTFTNNGSYSGSGAFNGGLFTNPVGGIVAPGSSPGCLSFGAGWTNAGTLNMEVNGLMPCSGHDQINVTGTATLGGTLNVTVGYTPANTDAVTIIDANTLSGTFTITNLPTNWTIHYNYPTTGKVTLIYLVPSIPLTCAHTLTFSSEYVNLSPTPAPDSWYTDRYAPSAFAQSADLGGTLRVDIYSGDGEGSRPSGFNTPFYNTQGRKYDLQSNTSQMSIRLYIPASWATSGRRMAGFWGTAFDNANTSGKFPIIEFTSDGGVPRFRGWEDDGTWHDMGLPTGFVYNSWVNLNIRVKANGQFIYTAGDLVYTTTQNMAPFPTHIANVILQGHNNNPGVTYDIHWDDLSSNTINLITNNVLSGCGPTDLTAPSITAGSVYPGGTTLGYFTDMAATIPVGTPTAVPSGTYYIKATNGACTEVKAVTTNTATPTVHNTSTGLNYCSIQSAIDAASAGNTIVVDAGNYVEAIVVNKSLTILGPNAAINPCSGVRVGEAVIIPPTSQPYYDGVTEVRMMQVEAANVTIKGFTFDGNNPALVTNVIDAADGIDVYANVGGLTVQNNIFKNLNEGGVTGFPSGGTAMINNTISENKFDNLPGNVGVGYPLSGYGIGVLVYNDFYANVNNNCMNNVRIGVQTGNYYVANTGTPATISNNTIASNAVGIFHNLHYANASPFTVNANQVTANDPANTGMLLWSFQTTASSVITNNTFTGGAVGIEAWNNPTTNTLTVSGGSITGARVGVLNTNYSSYGDAGSSILNVTGVTFTNCDTAMWVNDHASNTNSATVLLNVNNATNIVNGTGLGVLVEGADASVAFNGAVPVNFNTSLSKYIRLISNGINVPASNINAQNVQFGGTNGAGLGDAQLFAVENKIDHKIENKALGFVSVKALNAFVTHETVPTAINNDYTRVRNAVEHVSNGWKINLNGILNWAEPNAAASWALGNDGVASPADDYSILVPANLNNVTFTAPLGLGSATLQGPGDLAAVNLEGALIFDGGDNQNWTISNMVFDGFDLSIGMFNGAGGVDAFNGTTITNNRFNIPNDLNATVAPADVNQNIGLHYSFGTNQTISNNTFNIPGDGISNGVNLSSSVGMQSNTSGGNVYNGLQITGNTINVLNAQSASPQVVLGIWENGHAHTSNITVSNNQFLNLAVGNNATNNLQRGFRVTSHSGAGTTVTYSGNTVQGANIGMQWISGSNFTGNQPVQVLNNALTGNAQGIVVQSNGLANIQNNYISNGTEGINISGASAVTANINDLSGNSGFGINNTGSITAAATCNWWGSYSSMVIAGKVNGPVTYMPYLINGVDNSPAIGFQNTAACTIVAMADPSVVSIDMTNLSNVAVNPNQIPFHAARRIHIPLLNLTVAPSEIIPAGTTKVRISLGTKLDLNTGYNLATSPLSSYFNWTRVVEVDSVVIYGDQIADIPAGFIDVAKFDVMGIGATGGTSTIKTIWQITNHNNPTYTLIDNNMLNDTARLQYTELNQLVLNFVSKQNITCAGTNTGSITVQATGGLNPYQYRINAGPWVPVGGTSLPYTFTGLVAGTYTIEAMDVTGTISNSISVTLTQPANPDVSLGSVFDTNLFFNNGDEAIVVYNISELLGKAATPATLRVFKPSGYDIIFNNALTSVSVGGPAIGVDNPKWVMTAGPGNFYYDITRTGPGGGNQINCSELVRISITVKRNTTNISQFNLNAQFRAATGELILSNNNNSIIMSGE